MSQPLDMEHWESFGVALRICMVGFEDADETVAKAARCSVGAVRRGRCGQRVAELNFKRLCAFMDRDPSEFLKPDTNSAADVNATPRTTDAAVAPPRSRRKQSAVGRSSKKDALPASGSFDRW